MLYEALYFGLPIFVALQAMPYIGLQSRSASQRAGHDLGFYVRCLRVGETECTLALEGTMERVLESLRRPVDEYVGTLDRPLYRIYLKRTVVPENETPIDTGGLGVQSPSFSKQSAPFFKSKESSDLSRVRVCAFHSDRDAWFQSFSLENRTRARKTVALFKFRNSPHRCRAFVQLTDFDANRSSFNADVQTFVAYLSHNEQRATALTEAKANDLPPPRGALQRPTTGRDFRFS